MKKFLVFLYAIVLIFGIVEIARADLIFSEDFEDASGFTIGGGSAYGYWGVAPLSGMAGMPSNFIQGGGQSGNIFYGSFIKDFNNLNLLSTMTIILPDLTGYTNLQLTVALAASYGNWEYTHRDSIYIKGNTELIDSFLPAGYSGPLRSSVYSIDLNTTFQDFQYAIDNTLTSLTFEAGSTDYPEVIGIDSVRITGDPLPLPDVSGCIQLEGAPLIGVEVRLEQRDEDTQTTTTDSEGCYYFETINKEKDFTVNTEGEILTD